MGPNQLKSFCTAKETTNKTNKQKKQPRSGRKYLQMMKLTRASFPKHTGSPCNSTTKKQSNQKMGRRPKQTFPQGRHPDDQQAHEKMLIIGNYQRNANQNYSEVPPHTGQNGHH